MTKPVPRNRSLKFQDHQGLLMKLAKKYYGRLLSAQIPSTSFDDVMGELSLAFVKAAKGYDQGSEFTFTAFLGTCCQNHFNKYAKRLMLEHFGTESARDLEDGEYSNMGLGTISVEDMRGGADEDNDEGLFDRLADDGAVAPEDRINAEMTLNTIVNDKTLSAETRVYISMLANPALAISDAAKKRLRATTGMIRRELAARYGVEMSCIRV